MTYFHVYKDFFHKSLATKVTLHNYIYIILQQHTLSEYPDSECSPEVLLALLLSLDLEDFDAFCLGLDTFTFFGLGFGTFALDVFELFDFLGRHNLCFTAFLCAKQVVILNRCDILREYLFHIF